MKTASGHEFEVAWNKERLDVAFAVDPAYPLSDHWITLTPAEARDLADRLNNMARICESRAQQPAPAPIPSPSAKRQGDAMEYVDFLEKLPDGLGVTEKTLRLWFVIYQWIVENNYADSADSPAFIQHINAFRKCSVQTVATHLRRMSDAKLIKRNVLRRKLSGEAKEELSIGPLLFSRGVESIPTTFVRYCLPGQQCPTDFKSLDVAVATIDSRIHEFRKTVNQKG